MANATAYTSLNMLTSIAWLGSTTAANSTYIRLDSYPHRQDFFGSFTYSQTGLSGGTITSTTGYEYGAQSWSVSGLALNALIYNSYITANNIQGLYSYTLSGADTFSGSTGNDVLETFAGNDTLTGGSGNDILLGGTGTDTAIFSSSRSQYIYAPQAAGWVVVVGPNGFDAVKEIEVLQFSDQTVITSALNVPTVSGGAFVAAASSLDMSSTATWLGTYTHTDGTALLLENSTHNQGMFGSFSYNASGQLAGGTVQSMMTAEFGAAKSFVAGLNLDLGTYSSYIAANDLQGLYALALAGNDQIFGSTGNDILLGYGGNDALDGGPGIDTAKFAGPRAQYTLSATPAGWTMSGMDGVDALTNVEFAQFADQKISLGNYLPTGVVSISGSLVPGQTLLASNSLADLNGLGTIGYQWQLSPDGVTWSNIASATGGGFTVTEAHSGQRLRVTASYNDLHGYSESVSSSATSAVADTLPPVAPKLVTTAAFNFLVDPQVTMQTSLGNVVLELNPEQAPITASNLLAYANAGFYEGTLFHRVIPGFMVQGGGFTTGLVYKTPTYGAIALESNNGLSNLRGTIAMARINVADSATTQFFINQVDNLFLNYSSGASPGYAVFGKVMSGLPVIDGIAQMSTTTVGPYENVPVADVSIISLQQTLAGSAITNAGTLTVSDVEAGASWSYSQDGGNTWIAGTGSSFTVPVGSYSASAIQVRQTDAAGNVSTTTGKLTSSLVVETTAPTVSNFSPADEASGIGVASSIVITFSESIARGTGAVVLENAAGTVIESFDAASSSRLTLSGTTLTIDPTIDLAPGSGYRVEFAAGNVKDLAGNSYAGTLSYNFTTVPPPNTLPTGSVSVSGSATQGQLVSANASALADVDGLGTISYQWKAAGIAITGATASTFLLTEAQVGSAVTVTASYVDGYGTAEAVTSTATAAVANINDLPFGNLTVTGMPTTGQTLTAVSHLADADGLGDLNYQWQSSSNGSSWNDVSAAVTTIFPVTSDLIGQQVRIVGSYVDGHGTPETINSAPIDIFSTFSGKTASILGYTWKAHTVLEGIAVATPGGNQSTSGDGTANFNGVVDTSLALTVSRSIPTAEAAAADQSVNLQDAIAILKMIVGLDVNGAGKALSPYQAYAADFDGNGTVGLTDAIGVLKHVVGLTSPAPQWLFFDESDATMPGKANLNPGAARALTADLSEATTQVHVGLVGVLRGDVDGSFAGATSAPDLDATQSDYFHNLAATHGLNLSQFGVYA